MLAKESTINNWKYLREGGEHVIFEYRPTTTNTTPNPETKRWTGQILRIRKTSLMTLQGEQQQQQQHNNTKPVNLFICQAQMRLKAYFDNPETIYLELSSIHRLREQALTSGKIPSSRIADWQVLSHSSPPSSPTPIDPIFDSTPTDDTIDIDNNCFDSLKQSVKTIPNPIQYQNKISATIHPNYLHMPKTTTPSSLSIELKPKACYLATSPLVHPLHRAKYHHTRFEICQQLHHQGIISKGWCDDNTNTHTPPPIQSRYHPPDLFSNDPTRIQSALGDLFHTPQNNLRVVYKDSMLYGQTPVKTDNCEGGGGGDDEFRTARYTEALEDLFQITDEPSEGSSQHRLAEELQELTVRILQRETLLPTLGALQTSLDCLDGDGAVLVYRRLVEVMGGSMDQADAFLTSYSVLTTDIVPHGDSNLTEWNDFLQEIERTKRTNDNDDDDSYDRNYKRATELVNKFSTFTCGYLLQRWLASVTLCDISFFITICIASSSPSSQRQPQRRDNGRDGNGNKIVGANGCTWNYSINIVDCDPKPFSKLRKREKKESSFQYFKSDVI